MRIVHTNGDEMSYVQTSLLHSVIYGMGAFDFVLCSLQWRTVTISVASPRGLRYQPCSVYSCRCRQQSLPGGWHGTHKDSVKLPTAVMTDEGNLGASLSAFCDSGVKCWSGTMQNISPYGWVSEHRRWAMQSTTFHMATTSNRYAYIQLWCALRGRLNAYRLPILDVTNMSSGLPDRRMLSRSQKELRSLVMFLRAALRHTRMVPDTRHGSSFLESDQSSAPVVSTYGEWLNLLEHNYPRYTVLWDSSVYQGPQAMAWEDEVDSESWPFDFRAGTTKSGGGLNRTPAFKAWKILYRRPVL